MNTKIILTLASLALLACGCVSSSYHSRRITPGTSVSFDARENEILYGETREHIRAVLDRHGLTIATNSPGALVLKTGVGHGFTSVKARVGLVEGKKVVVIGTAKNLGWGTWMAPRAAGENIIHSAIMAFDRELGKACKPEPALHAKK